MPIPFARGCATVGPVGRTASPTWGQANRGNAERLPASTVQRLPSLAISEYFGGATLHSCTGRGLSVDRRSDILAPGRNFDFNLTLPPAARQDLGQDLVYMWKPPMAYYSTEFPLGGFFLRGAFEVGELGFAQAKFF